MDDNCYNPSVVQQITDYRCFLCGRTSGKMDRHEIFHGAYREKSKELGLWVTLCHADHMRLHHLEPRLDKRLKRMGQRAAMNCLGWTKEKFIREFGKNYLEEDERC